MASYRSIPPVGPKTVNAKSWPSGQGACRFPLRDGAGPWSSGSDDAILADAIRRVLWYGGLQRHLSRVPLQALSLCLSSAEAREASGAPLIQDNKESPITLPSYAPGFWPIVPSEAAWKFVCLCYVQASYKACDTLRRTVNPGSDKAPHACHDLDAECLRLYQAHFLLAWN